MRVGFDARWYNDSGVGVYVAELLRAMTAAEQPRFELLVYENPLNPVPELEGARFVRVAVKARKYSLAEQLEFRTRAKQDRLDVFHSPFYAAPLALSCPVVVTVHDLIPFLFPIYNWPKRALIKMGYRSAVRRACHIIAVSDTTAHDLQRILNVPPEKITTIHSAAAKDYSPSVSEADELESLCRKYNVRPPYVMVSSARNWRTKNLQGALQALQIAALQSGIKFQTVVYGPPEGIRALSALERCAGLDLRGTGYLQRSELSAFFRHAHAFLMPSLYEGFGLPVLEAMSCGCPVVTSNAGSLPEVAGRGAQVFAPEDCAGMGAAVAELLRNPEARRDWQGKALTRARDFSWSQAAAETISVYHRIDTQAISSRTSLTTQSHH